MNSSSCATARDTGKAGASYDSPASGFSRELSPAAAAAASPLVAQKNETLSATVSYLQAVNSRLRVQNVQSALADLPPLPVARPAALAALPPVARTLHEVDKGLEQFTTGLRVVSLAAAPQETIKQHSMLADRLVQQLKTVQGEMAAMHPAPRVPVFTPAPAVPADAKLVGRITVPSVAVAAASLTKSAPALERVVVDGSQLRRLQSALIGY